MPASVTVVGGGIAGVSTIAAMRAGGFDGDITLVDADEFPYDRPPLSKDYLSGRSGIKDIVLQPQQWYDDHSVRLITGRAAAALRTGVGAVELDDGTHLRADRVVLATGGRAVRPSIPGADSPRVHTLRTAADADRLRGALVPGAAVLIIGAGLIGAEVASTASALGCVVTVADAVSTPMAAAFGADVAAWLHDVHRNQGVTTVHGVVSAIETTGSRLAVTLAGEEHPRSFDAVLLAVGMAPDTALAAAAGLRVDHGVLVDDCQVTSNQAVLAVGDAARRCVNGAPGPRSEHWEAAQHDGQRAAAAILGTARPVDTAPWFWTDRYGLHVEAVGTLNNSVHTVHRGTFGEPPFSVFAMYRGQVVGAVTVGDSTVVRAARRMIDRNLQIDADQLADPAADVRKLARGRV